MVDTVHDRIRPVSISVAEPTDPAVSPDGRTVAFTAEQSDFDVDELSVVGRTVKPVLATAASEHSPAWDPTGHGFAYVTDRSGPDEIWFCTQGTNRPVITERDFPGGLTYYLGSPAFSPDGQRIAFTRRVRGGTTSIWIAPAMGGPAVRLAPGEVSQSFPTWSPDGNWIAYLSTSGGKATLLKARVGGSGGSQVLKENAGLPPRWSPQGNWIAYGTADEFGLLSPDGHTSRVLSKETWLSSEWSRDGTVIYGIRYVEGEMVLFSMDMRSRLERKLGALGGAARRTSIGRPTFSLAPDGKTLLFSLYKRRGDIWLLEDFQQRLGLLQTQWREHVPD
jgi:Tol biopolymer transport system component